MNYVEFFVDKIIHSEEHPDADFLFLKEERGEVTIPIIIGRTEGRAISIGLDKDSLFSRPLSYDVFKSFIQLTGYKIQKITIDGYLHGVYETKIHFFHSIELNQFYLESRISDAVAMAVRFSVPIYVESSVVEKNYFNEELSKIIFSECRMIEKDLKNAVAREDFDKAIELQQKLKNIKEIKKI